jgi:putative CocE/NonD family hydrolase
MDAGTEMLLSAVFTAEHPQWCSQGMGRRTVHASPYQPANSKPDPTPPGQWAEMIRVLDAHRKDGQDADFEYLLHYYMMGAEVWKKTPVWPPQGTRYQRWYFDNGGSLTPQPVQDLEGQDKFEVDFEATTGNLNRWWELSGTMSKSVIYPDRSQAVEHMLTYTTPVLDSDLEITGHPVVRLYVTSTEPDGAFFVYLEDVHPNGKVTYITEGVLRAIHRRAYAESIAQDLEIPQHTYLTEDGDPLKPGEPAELRFCLLPTSVLLKQGHRLRVSIAGHDKGTFLRIPAQGTPVVTILRNHTYPSSIDLPGRGKQ